MSYWFLKNWLDKHSKTDGWILKTACYSAIKTNKIMEFASTFMKIQIYWMMEPISRKKNTICSRTNATCFLLLVCLSSESLDVGIGPGVSEYSKKSQIYYGVFRRADRTTWKGSSWGQLLLRGKWEKKEIRLTRVGVGLEENKEGEGGIRVR